MSEAGERASGEPSSGTEPAPRSWMQAALFLATVLTTTVTGALFIHPGSIWPIADGLSYSVPLMAILVCHELGHYFAARLHGVRASLPYFIPLPPGLGLFGTMGAVISQAGTTDRRKLIDIGAAGPLAGLAVAIPVLAYGLTLSDVRPLQGVGLQEGNSLLYAVLKYVTKGAWLPTGGRDVILHPTAWAGWAGLLVTMLNLLPVGQLDGGHIATAYFGNRYARVARIVHQGLPWLSLLAFGWVYRLVQREALGQELPPGLTPLKIAVYASLSWLVWYMLLWVVGRASRGFDHPLVDDDQGLPRSRSTLFWVVAIAFALIFMPVPLRWSIGVAAPTPALPGSIK
jgi:membrane-associated protease RseP (regulator of RpoE activity)